MRRWSLWVVCALGTAFASGAVAQNITGTILIKRRLTRPKVTPTVPVYQRGAGVKLGKDEPQKPVDYEQTRVVVYLEGAAAEPEASGAEPPAVEVAQQDRRFVPDLVAIPVGSAVSFPNHDPIFHNIFSLSKAKSFDLGSYDRGQTRKVVFTKAGIVEVYCHLHPNMAATIVVTPTRWYARPDSAGRYRIDNVPPGKYTLVAWHKSAGFFRKPIEVMDGHETVTDFFIPLAEEAKGDEQKKTGGAEVGAQ